MTTPVAERVDVNAEVSWALRDMAAVQEDRQKEFGYKRAASAVFWLEQPLTDLWTPTGLAGRVRGIGPASSRIIAEVMETGSSPTVERAIDERGKRADIAKRRSLRSHFLSRAAVLRVLADTSLSSVSAADYQGDFQMHSEWSDGAVSVGELAAACAERGYRYAAITDHSYGLRIAGGMSMTEAQAQHREIDRLNASSSFRVLKGIEANIGADGVLDLSADEARAFEIVLAAPHSKLRTTDDQTARLLRAIEQPEVHILAHPRGRMVGSRAGIAADWDAVFAAAAREGVAIELDGDPARQDLDFELAARALGAGCLFALDSDAHTPSQLLYAETALAHARLAKIPHDRIVNCWDFNRLDHWLVHRLTA
jgi:histidinol phosphatase-like PHP family hydrolase